MKSNNQTIQGRTSSDVTASFPLPRDTFFHDPRSCPATLSTVTSKNQWELALNDSEGVIKKTCLEFITIAGSGEESWGFMTTVSATNGVVTLDPFFLARRLVRKGEGMMVWDIVVRCK